MKRRSFLRALAAVPLAAAVPAFARSEPQPVTDHRNVMPGSTLGEAVTWDGRWWVPIKFAHGVLTGPVGILTHVNPGVVTLWKPLS